MLWNKEKFFINAGVKKINMDDFGGGELYIKKITLGDRNSFVECFNGVNIEENKVAVMKAIPALVKITVCNEKGELLLDKFTDEEIEKMDADLVDFLYKEASEYNKLIDPEAIKNAAKKS